MSGFYTSREHGNHHVRFKGSFAPSGAGISATPGAVRGTGFAVAYGGATGVYRVTLEDNFKQLISAQLGYQGLTADTDDITLRLGDVNPGNRTIDIVALAAGAKANITASAIARRINFEFVVAQNDTLGSGATA